MNLRRLPIPLTRDEWTVRCPFVTAAAALATAFLLGAGAAIYAVLYITA